MWVGGAGAGHDVRGKLFVALGKGNKADFLQARCDRSLKLGRTSGLKSGYSREKWELTAGSRVGRSVHGKLRGPIRIRKDSG